MCGMLRRQTWPASGTLRARLRLASGQIAIAARNCEAIQEIVFLRCGVAVTGEVAKGRVDLEVLDRCVMPIDRRFGLQLCHGELERLSSGELFLHANHSDVTVGRRQLRTVWQFDLDHLNGVTALPVSIVWLPGSVDSACARRSRSAGHR